MDTRLGVKGLIVRDETFLVLVKPGGRLDIPGGRVKPNEWPFYTFYREIAEETGLSVTIDNLVYSMDFY